MLIARFTKTALENQPKLKPLIKKDLHRFKCGSNEKLISFSLRLFACVANVMHVNIYMDMVGLRSQTMSKYLKADTFQKTTVILFQFKIIQSRSFN